MINKKNEMYKQYIGNRKLKHDYNSLASIGNTLVELKILKGKLLLRVFQQIKQSFNINKNILNYT